MKTTNKSYFPSFTPHPPRRLEGTCILRFYIGEYDLILIHRNYPSSRILGKRPSKHLLKTVSLIDGCAGRAVQLHLHFLDSRELISTSSSRPLFCRCDHFSGPDILRFRWVSVVGIRYTGYKRGDSLLSGNDCVCRVSSLDSCKIISLFSVDVYSSLLVFS